MTSLPNELTSQMAALDAACRSHNADDQLEAMKAIGDPTHHVAAAFMSQQPESLRAEWCCAVDRLPLVLVSRYFDSRFSCT